MPIEWIKIDNNLEKETWKKETIDKIKTLDESAIIDFLNNEPLDVVVSWTGKDEVVEKKTMKDIMQAFQKYTIDWVSVSYTPDAPEWIKKVIDTPEHDDLLYLIQTIKSALSMWVPWAANEAGETVIPPLDMQTIKDLRLLQWEIQDVTIEDINKLTLSDKQWVSPQGVLKALTSLNKINPSLWKKISLLIKKWDILWIQLALGMVVGSPNINKNADGVFGASTLNNLWAWKVVKTNLAITSSFVRGDDILPLIPNQILINDMNDVRKWWWSWEAQFLYFPHPKFSQSFYSDWRFVQEIDVTKPQSILERASKGTQLSTATIEWKWSYNEDGQMTITFGGGIKETNSAVEDLEAKMKLNRYIVSGGTQWP